MADDAFSSLPDDAFVQVLLLLPTSSRRRFRLVCKRWRGFIDKRTPERQVRTKILAFFAETCGSRAVVFDDGEVGSLRLHAWTYPCSYDLRYDLVGTCNGLLCLHQRSALSINAGSLSAISVTNPITGELQLLPPAPTQWYWEKFKALGLYSFGYHPTTGEYKVVHIPCQRGQAVRAVWVFTLGGGTSSWREVPVTTPGGASCHHSCEAVSVDGSTYWLNASTDKVMALDLEDELVTWLHVPPSVVWRGHLTPKEGGWQLTSVHARLGIARTTASARVDLWVLENGSGRAGRPRWARRCTLPDPRGHLGRWIMAPHLTHREYAMSRSWGRARLYRSKVGNLIDRHGINGLPPLLGSAELVMDDDTRHYEEMKTFAYVETLEPLPAMNGPAAGDGGSNQPLAANGGMEKN